MLDATSTAVPSFLERWRHAGASERANYALYLSELCDILGVERPRPKQPGSAQNEYVFEMPVDRKFLDGTKVTNFIDLYRKGAFVLEAKQGAEAQLAPEAFTLTATPVATRKGIGVRGTTGWATEMLKARAQAEQYAKDLPNEHGWPPFLLVVDVGYCIELWADFSRTGKNYSQFPDRHRFRIFHDDDKETGRPTLADPAIRALLAQVWTQPLELDPSRHAAKVTRQIAGKLAELAKAMEHRRVEAGVEKKDHDSEEVALFLMRCLFTMFAEDVGILPKDSFRTILESLRAKPHLFAAKVSALWQEMDEGKTPYSGFIEGEMPKFNGKLFKGAQALPVSATQLELLIDAAKADWSQVEPAIFGTLLERALDEKERHKLGAHYTPRAYVERLVLPTVIEPLRAEWQTALAEANVYLVDKRRPQAIQRLREYHQHLCTVRVLDPACGTGNFLYVTLEHMKRLEGEVLQHIADLQKADRAAVLKAHDTPSKSVTPSQFKGIEVNPRAAILADVVLWIGYLQWHAHVISRTEWPYRPILGKFEVVERRDAVLDWDGAPMRRLVLDEAGKPVTRWDGVSVKKHPVTGLDVPDEDKRRIVEVLEHPKKASWPDADYVVGNPPFIGNWRMRSVLGDGYTEALRAAYPEVPDSVDFVMYWWQRAAELLRAGKIKRFGFITTNSITQTFNRRVMQQHFAGKDPLSLAFAVPDHPWVDATDGAAVRIGMTVAVPGESLPGQLFRVVGENPGKDEEVAVDVTQSSGVLHADLKIGANVTGARALLSNARLSSPGVKLHGAGFIVTREQAAALGLGRIPGLDEHIREYRNGKDLTAKSRDVLVIDLFGVTEDSVRREFPEVYQYLREQVWPERAANARDVYRVNWWIFGEPRRDFRPALAGLPRYLATVETAKHRVFQFLDATILPDNMLINVGTSDAWHLGVLSSRLHVVWARAAGGTLEDRPRYNKSVCFDPFPFPAATEPQQARIRALAEDLDAHRKRQQAQHPDLTLTGMYNVLQALRDGRVLTAKERTIHDQGLCTLLRQLHDDLDAAVLAAYDWPTGLEDEAILQRLCDLNAERVAEERQGLVRWLRPEFQNPARPDQGHKAELALVEVEDDAPELAAVQVPWPKKPVDMLAAVKKALAEARGPLTLDGLAAQFSGAQVLHVEAMLAALEAAGGALEVAGGTWVVG
jgi:hypothetical protein